MPATSYVSSATIVNHAEQELAAFRQAATDVVGQGSLARVTDIWIRTLESLDCPDEDLEKFFRRVTIRTVAQLKTELQ